MDETQLSLFLVGISCGIVLACLFFGAGFLYYGRQVSMLIRELRIARRNTPNPEG